MTTNVFLHSHTTFLFLIAFHCLLPLCYFQELAMQTQRNAPICDWHWYRRGLEDPHSAYLSRGCTHTHSYWLDFAWLDVTSCHGTQRIQSNQRVSESSFIFKMKKENDKIKKKRAKEIRERNFSTQRNGAVFH